jgi:hypothetical protein
MSDSIERKYDNYYPHLIVRQFKLDVNYRESVKLMYKLQEER